MPDRVLRTGVVHGLTARRGSYMGIAVAFVFAATAPGRAIPGLLAPDPTSAGFVCALVVLSTVAILVSLKRGGRLGRPARAAVAEVRERCPKTDVK
jgi:hypothetical protein